MTTPTKGSQRSVDDCIRMASWNIKEISECMKELCASVNILTTRLEQAITRLGGQKPQEPRQQAPKDDGSIPF